MTLAERHNLIVSLRSLEISLRLALVKLDNKNKGSDFTKKTQRLFDSLVHAQDLTREQLLALGQKPFYPTY